MRLVLPDRLRGHLRPDDPFASVLRLDGQVFRHHKQRRTFRCKIGDRDYFVKVHSGSGWPEVLKSVLRLRSPTLTAEPEWRAIQTLRKLSIPTVREVAFGRRGWNPAQLDSFIITEPLEGFVHLDDVVASEQDRSRSELARFKRTIIEELATITRGLHTNGLNHRDLYLCHFMLPPLPEVIPAGFAAQLHIIDLHRVQSRAKTPRRWIAKDLSGLLFSALDGPLTTTDCTRFLRDYWGSGWRSHSRARRGFLRGVIRRAIRLYRSEHGRSPRLPVGLASF